MLGRKQNGLLADNRLHDESSAFPFAAGLKPVPGTWKHWDVMKLQSDGDGAANEVNAATKKMMEAAALNKKSMQRSTASRASSVC